MTQLIVRRVWDLIQAGVRRMYSGGTPLAASTAHPSPAIRLPQEIIELIIGRLIYDKRSLRACTLTCRSWYIATVSHLHHTLAIEMSPHSRGSGWPNPLRQMHTLGLLPLVKRFWARGDCSGTGLSPGRFSSHTLRHFSALTSVQELEMDYLDIPNFVPQIRRYFNHFSPTVRSLVLRGPKGSPRQIIYFIGFFQHLQDLKLVDTWVNPQDESTDDSTLIPLFVPPLRGWLTARSFTKLGLLKGMIHLLGGIRFRYMNLFNVDGLRILLDACAETLEYLVLNPTDPWGGRISLKGVQVLTNDSIVVSSLLDLNLSRHKSLRTLGVPASSFNRLPTDCWQVAVNSLNHILPTIACSSAILDITIIYTDDELPVRSQHSDPAGLSQAVRAGEVTRHHLPFEVLREVHKVRDFRLILCASVLGCRGEYSAQSLEEAIAEEKARGGFDEYFYEPSVVYNPRRPHDWT